MKKLLVLSVLLMGSFSLFAQPSKVLNAYSYLQDGDLLAAKGNIDAATTHDRTSTSAKTWYYRGKIYQAIYLKQVNDSEADYGIDPATAILTATESFEKALSMDCSRIDAKDLKNNYLICADFCFQEGVNNYNSRTYDVASRLFKQCVHVKAENGITDSLAIYNTALALENAGDPDEAIKNYRKCVAIGYNAANCQYFMANLMHRSGLYREAISAAKEGMQRYPEQSSFLNILINAHLALNQTEEAFIVIEEAITKDPKNADLYFMRGSMLEASNPKESVENYEQALSINPDHRNSLYNLGAYYFNLAVDAINTQNAPEEAGKDLMKKALPYLQHLHDLVPGEPTVSTFLEQAKEVIGE